MMTSFFVQREGCMQDTFARARTRPSARDDRVSCIQERGLSRDDRR